MSADFRPAISDDAAAPRQAWLIVATLFFALFFIFGSGYNTAGVFFTPVIRSFGWSRARLSTMQTALAIAAGLSAPLAGWMLDRVEARIVMAVGTASAGCGFVVAALAHSYAAMVAAYLLIGAGIGGATLLPCSTVIANWFGDRRGLAMGLAMAGTSAGVMVMTLVSDRVIRRIGWRAGYLMLAVPVFAVVMPAVLIAVRTRPHRGAQAQVPVRGMEIGPALAGRSFWMVCAATLCFALAVSGTNLHSVPHLIGLGYAPARAALTFSLVLAFGGMGKLCSGWIADRIGARVALAAALAGMALGIGLLTAASQRTALAAYVAVYGLTFGAPLVLLPLLMAEAVGLRRFGSLYGLAGVFHTAGSALGPVIAGHIFDLRGAYSRAFEAFVILLIIGAAAAFACAPMPATAAQSETACAPL